MTPNGARNDALRTYDTRFDCFRRQEKLDPSTWGAAAGMSRSQVNHYRSGHQMPKVTTLARLVAAAARLLGRPVRASELYDVGEDEPLGSRRFLESEGGRPRQTFDTPLDELIRRNNFRTADVADESGISRQLLLRYRAGRATMRVSSLARIVRAFRRNGFDVRASDVADVGEG